MEIEKKYLTKEIPFALEGFICKQMIQSYLSFQPAIRIRKSEEHCFLTVKGKGHMAREEFELEINQHEYERLHEKIEGNEVRKKRYYIPLEHGYTAELDIYEGELEGLMTTEVEFPTLVEAEAFLAPQWFGEDISMDSRYKNTSLAHYGKPRVGE
ncbi:MAG: CYTH domain-containing protein [Anaerotignum sp.]|nr:CYTH domain-containing protein [Anaerotignum sp.]